MIYFEIYYYLMVFHMLAGILLIRISDKSDTDKEDAYIGWFILSLLWFIIWIVVIYQLFAKSFYPRK